MSNRIKGKHVLSKLKTITWECIECGEVNIMMGYEVPKWCSMCRKKTQWRIKK